MGLEGWLYEAVLNKLDHTHKYFSFTISLVKRGFYRAVIEPRFFPDLKQAFSDARQLIGEPHYSYIDTPRSIVEHFEEARGRYLESVNNDPGKAEPYIKGDIDTKETDDGRQALQSSGLLPIKKEDVESSNKETIGLGASSAQADVENNVQVEGDSLLKNNQAFIKALELWLELSREEDSQESADDDMMSASDQERED